VGLISKKQVGFFQNIEWVYPRKAGWGFQNIEWVKPRKAV